VDRPDGAPATGDMAEVLSVEPDQVLQVRFAGVGLPFCLVRLASPSAVDRAAINHGAWSRHMADAWSRNIFFYSGELTDGGHLHARMCAPALGIDEDPATGSASAALVGAWALDHPQADGTVRLAIRQGVAMGRPSDIEAAAHKSGGILTAISITGATAYFASGALQAPDGSP